MPTDAKREQQVYRLAAMRERTSLPAVRPRVWLLEDSPLQAEQTKHALAGLDLTHFWDGGSLLEQLTQSEPPDLMILDWELPGVTGHDVLRFARRTYDEVTLPILVLTGDAPALIEAFESGANDFVAKSGEDVALRARVQTLLRIQMLGARTRQAEQERTDALERVYDAETRMHLALEAASIGTWELDPQTNLLQLDANGQTIMDLGPRAVFADSVRRIHPDDRARVESALAASFDPQRRAPYSVEYRVVDERGQRWHAAWGRPFFDGDTPVRLVGAVLDVTERKQASDAMERDALFRERFIAILAHDLRTPLTALRLGSQLLTRRSVSEAAAKDIGLRIEATSKRMERMIADLLDFTRSRQGGGMPIERAAMDLEPIARSVVEEVQLAAPQRSILLESSGDTCGQWDAGRLQQIVSNLVSNAIDYSPPGSTVRVALRARPDAVLLEVQNDGELIPPETLRSLFDPFRRGASESTSSRRSRGLGLGLYIVEQIADAHDGSVTVTSTAETGTRFTVTLPR